jgi:hypothetical protein
MRNRSLIYIIALPINAEKIRANQENTLERIATKGSWSERSEKDSVSSDCMSSPLLHKSVLNIIASICFSLSLHCNPHNVTPLVCYSHHLQTTHEETKSIRDPISSL